MSSLTATSLTRSKSVFVVAMMFWGVVSLKWNVLTIGPPSLSCSSTVILSVPMVCETSSSSKTSIQRVLGVPIVRLSKYHA